MTNKNKKFYITTSIPYTNAPPHIGFALEAIQADVLARYHKCLGEDVFFLTGTDEHGIKTLRVAREAGRDPKDFADGISGKFRELTKILNISNNDFIRTTDETKHKPAVEKLWKKLDEAGDIYKKKYKGYYCPGCEAFKTEKEIVDGKCPIHLKELEFVEEENYFFRLSKYTKEVEEKIRSGEIEIIPESRKNETLSMLKQGMEDVSFSRTKDKYWGFEVPGDPEQVMYVWCDALPNYISAIGYDNETEQFKKYWPADVHCLGKDIMKFHTIFWPAMLLSAKLALPKKIFVHGFINVGGQKMSKSLGNVVDPFELVNKYGVDAVRYYLLREIVSAEDGDFTYEKFEQRYNADLAGGIGNLVARTLGISDKISNFEFRISNKFSNLELKKQIEKTQKNYKLAIESFKFNEALISVWEIISFCDKYINEEKLWETPSTSSGQAKKMEVINDLFFAIKEIGILLEPFLPQTSEKIKKVVEKPFDSAQGRSEILFPRLENKK
ncbi:MAG: methionine--tRNA ligase [Candidatus Staskawiczbacteria bacterium]|nr:methionine--tRNA ligase [Candidatus Staskawiczbacteria bacterium]